MARIGMEEKIIALVAAACVGLGLWNCFAAEDPNSDDRNAEENPGRREETAFRCEGPRDGIQLSGTAEIKGDKTVVRLTFESADPVQLDSLTLGDGAIHEWMISAKGSPADVIAPADWEGQLVFEYEGPYQYIFWQRKSTSPPLKRLEGFGFSIPTSVLPTKSLPFQMNSIRPKCLWGRWSIERKEPSK